MSEKRKLGEFRVIDIGGGLGNWAQDFSDVCVDMKSAGNPSVIAGDLYDPNTWQKLNSSKFDLAILSHILEDVRDPFFIIEQALKVSSLLYISVPSMFLEFSHLESNRYVGYIHHRWLFASDGNQLFIAPKTSLANAWSSDNSLLKYALDYLRLKLKIEDNYSYLHSRLGWTKFKIKKSDIKKTRKDSSLSLIIDKSIKVESFDYIESGHWLLSKYNSMLEVENSHEI